MNISTNLLISDDKSVTSSLLFECAKSFVSEGNHVHYIAKEKTSQIPLKVHGAEAVEVEVLSLILTIKYIKNVDQLLEYGCFLQYIQSRQGKLPKVIIIQDLEVYLTDESKGVLAVATLLDSLNALSRLYNRRVYLLAGLQQSSQPLRMYPFLIDNFFSNVWKITREGDKGSIIRLSNYSDKQDRLKEITFGIGEERMFFEAMRHDH